jgi:hypothetical protein
VDAKLIAATLVVATWLVTLGVVLRVLRRRRQQAKSLRRGAPSYAPEWSGRYRTDASVAWLPCRVIDLSRTGAAIEQKGQGDATLEEIVHLEVPAPSGSPDGIVLTGEIRYATRSSTGQLRAGIEFIGPSMREEELLDLLLGLHRIP